MRVDESSGENCSESITQLIDCQAVYKRRECAYNTFCSEYASDKRRAIIRTPGSRRNGCALCTYNNTAREGGIIFHGKLCWPPLPHRACSRYVCVIYVILSFNVAIYLRYINAPKIVDA